MQQHTHFALSFVKIFGDKNRTLQNCQQFLILNYGLGWVLFLFRFKLRGGGGEKVYIHKSTIKKQYFNHHLQKKEIFLQFFFSKAKI